MAAKTTRVDYIAGYIHGDIDGKRMAAVLIVAVAFVRAFRMALPHRIPDEIQAAIIGVPDDPT